VPSIKLPCGEWGWAEHDTGDRLITCPIHTGEEFIARAVEVRSVKYEVRKPYEKKDGK
jgi:hypothetical protein